MTKSDDVDELHTVLQKYWGPDFLSDERYEHTLAEFKNGIAAGKLKRFLLDDISTQARFAQGKEKDPSRAGW